MGNTLTQDELDALLGGLSLEESEVTDESQCEEIAIPKEKPVTKSENLSQEDIDKLLKEFGL
jgi:flagellar motor switch protein FliM